MYDADDDQRLAAPIEDVWFERALGGFSDFARAVAERPDPFWDRQRLRIHHRLQPAQAARIYRRAWVWAPVVVLTAIVLTLSVDWKGPAAPGRGVQDQDLLVGIECSLSRQVPAALQPVMILTKELDDSAAFSMNKRGNP